MAALARRPAGMCGPVRSGPVLSCTPTPTRPRPPRPQLPASRPASQPAPLLRSAPALLPAPLSQLLLCDLRGGRTRQGQVCCHPLAPLTPVCQLCLFHPYIHLHGHMECTNLRRSQKVLVLVLVLVLVPGPLELGAIVCLSLYHYEGERETSFVLVLCSSKLGIISSHIPETAPSLSASGVPFRPCPRVLSTAEHARYSWTGPIYL
jgi:hypothetical protein